MEASRLVSLASQSLVHSPSLLYSHLSPSLLLKKSNKEKDNELLNVGEKLKIEGDTEKLKK